MSYEQVLIKNIISVYRNIYCFIKVMSCKVIVLHNKRVDEV